MAEIDYVRPLHEKNQKETICDIHRAMYQFLKNNYDTNDDGVKFLLENIEVAFKMGKSMDAKLRQYKNNYDDEWWETNKKAWDWDELKGIDKK